MQRGDDLVMFEAQNVKPAWQIPAHHRPISFRRILMKAVVLAAFVMLALGTGAAAAPGHAATATAKGYGQAWAEIHRGKCQHTK
jgi:hypothetical protein